MFDIDVVASTSWRPGNVHAVYSKIDTVNGDTIVCALWAGFVKFVSNASMVIRVLGHVDGICGTEDGDEERYLEFGAGRM